MDVQERGVVRADVDHDGQDPRRVDSSSERVNVALADTDQDASNSLISDTEDSLRIGHDDEIDLFRWGRFASQNSLTDRTQRRNLRLLVASLGEGVHCVHIEARVSAFAGGREKAKTRVVTNRMRWRAL